MRGPFAAIAVAARAENHDDSTGRDATGSLEDIAQRVIGVGIIHQHTERLSLINALKTTWHRSQTFNALDSLFDPQAQPIRRCQYP